jgi:hypothetical protein
MPIPKPDKDEKTQNFIARCMSNETMTTEYKDNGQRYAICISQTKVTKTKSESSILDDVLEALNDILEYEEGIVEDVDMSNPFVPADEDYLDFYEETEDYEFSTFKFVDPITEEVFFYDRMGNWQKNGRRLIFRGRSSETNNKKVKLNKPFRTPDGPKKFSVYVKNEKGNVVKVNFGDPNMKIKKHIPERRRSFRARHNCDNPGPKYKARYWACKSW